MCIYAADGDDQMVGDTGIGRALVLGLQILLPTLKPRIAGESATECVCKQVCVCGLACGHFVV